MKDGNHDCRQPKSLFALTNVEILRKQQKSKDFSCPSDPRSFQNEVWGDWYFFLKRVRCALPRLFIWAVSRSLSAQLCACVYLCANVYTWICVRVEEPSWDGEARETDLSRNPWLCFLCRWKGVEVEVWAHVIALVSEHLSAPWRDYCVPIMGDWREPNSQESSSAVEPAWCQLGRSEQTYASLKMPRWKCILMP